MRRSGNAVGALCRETQHPDAMRSPMEALGFSRAAEAAASLAASAFRQARLNPALFLVQASRRLPPSAVDPMSSIMARMPNSGLRALGSHLQGKNDQAAHYIRSAIAQHVRSPLLSAVALAIGYDREAVALAPCAQRPAMTVRAAWSAGLVAEAREAALALPRSHHLRRHVLEEIDLLQPQAHVALPPGIPRWSKSLSDSDQSRPTRVLHVLTNSLPHTQSGYSLRSHRILRAQAEAGLHVTAVTRMGYPWTVGRLLARRSDTVDSVRYIRIPERWSGGSKRRRLELQALELSKIVDDLEPDIIHCTSDYTNALVAEAVAERHGLPWVYEVRGLPERTWAASKPDPASRELATRSARAHLIADKEASACDSAHAVFTLSATMRDVLVARGVPRETISLAPNCVSSSLFDITTSPAEARAALDLPERFTVGAVSSLVDYEGFDTLLEAVRILLGDGETTGDVQILLAGDGTARRPLIDLATRLSIEDRVILPGRVPSREGPMWQCACDVIVIPRRDLDVCRAVTPIKPVEALALSRPLIASDLPALREVMGSGPGRTFVTPDSPESLATAIGFRMGHELSAEDRAAMRNDARARSWEALAQQYADVYTSLRTRAGRREFS